MPCRGKLILAIAIYLKGPGVKLKLGCVGNQSLFLKSGFFVQACPYTWRSWFWQFNENDERDDTPVRLIMAKAPNPMPLFTVLCINCFYKLPRGFIEKLCMDQPDVHLDGGEDLFELCRKAIMQHLAKTEEEAMEILAIRLHANCINDHYAPWLLELDETMNILEKDDWEKIRDQQRQNALSKQDRETYKDKYSKKRKEIRAAKEAANKGKGGKGGGKGKGKKGGFRWQSHFSLEEAKAFLPPTATTWRARIRRAWCGHFKPAPRIFF